MHMHFLFPPNPMKLGTIGMLSASLRYIMIEEHHVICLWKHWYRTICKRISTVLYLYNNLEMRCGSLQLLALMSISMTRLLRCVFYFCSCRSFQHTAHNLYLSNCTTRSLPLSLPLKPHFPIAFLASWCRNCGTIVRSYHNPTEKIRQ